MNPNSLYLNSLRNALQGNLHEAQNAYEKAELLKEAMGLDYSEPSNDDLPYLEEALTTLLSSYDFTRCVRPDGSVYGSRGKCRKGTEAAPEDRRGQVEKLKKEAKEHAAKGEFSKGAKKALKAHGIEKGIGTGIIGNPTPAQIAAMENKAAQMRNRNAQADRAALARKVAKELGKDVRSVEVAKEVEKRRQQR